MRSETDRHTTAAARFADRFLTCTLSVERVTGIEPALAAWELACQPLAATVIAGQPLLLVVRECPPDTAFDPPIGHGAGTLASPYHLGANRSLKVIGAALTQLATYCISNFMICVSCFFPYRLYQVLIMHHESLRRLWRERPNAILPLGPNEWLHDHPDLNESCSNPLALGVSGSARCATDWLRLICDRP
jgi:hypothetical protein